MILFLVILTFAVFIGISYLSDHLNKRIVAKPVPVGPPLERVVRTVMPPAVPSVAVLPATDETTPRVEGYTMPESLYYHQGHAWVALQDSGTAVIGIDEFATRFAGSPHAIELPKVGARCKQGEKGWSISRGEKVIDMLFPLDGEVVAVNERALAHPKVLSEEPYGKGWLMMIKASDLRRNLRNLLSGPMAKRWMEESAAELMSMFSGKLGTVYQDGGLPEDGVADHLETEEWRTFVRRFFLMERTEKLFR